MKSLCSFVYEKRKRYSTLISTLYIMKHCLAKTFAISMHVNLTEGSYDFDITLKDISPIDDSKQGFSKAIINTK